MIKLSVRQCKWILRSTYLSVNSELEEKTILYEMESNLPCRSGPRDSLITPCLYPEPASNDRKLTETSQAAGDPQAESFELTPLPTRPVYQPGELVSYTVQSGDTLPALAAHFNTTVAEIQQENEVLPESTTTLPAGLPLQIPIYYQPLWGSSYQIIPDCLFPNGPAQIDFDPVANCTSAAWLV